MKIKQRKTNSNKSLDKTRGKRRPEHRFHSGRENTRKEKRKRKGSITTNGVTRRITELNT